MTNVCSVILAGGKSQRMKSRMNKVFHKLCGRPMINYVVDAASEISGGETIIVIGEQTEKIQEFFGEHYQYARQEYSLGTGNAFFAAYKYLMGRKGYVFVLPGDIPFITSETLGKMLEYAESGDFDCVLLSTVYCFRLPSLLNWMDKNHYNPSDVECSLNDLVEGMKEQGMRIEPYTAVNNNEIFDVNDRVELAEAGRLMRERINRVHMNNGVTIISPENTYIDFYVKIGQDTVIYQGNSLEGDTNIGEECILYPGNRIVNSDIKSKASIQNSVILDSCIGEGTTVGPFAYLRPGSVIGNNVRIGDFVEIKNSQIGDGTKVSHLTYIGDGSVGKGVNVGCGVVFVNYDGEKKHRTQVGDRAFIGCNVNLVAPVVVEDDAFIAAGSTITEKVPRGALSIARERQINKEGWVEKRRKEKNSEQ